MYIYKMLI